MMRKSASTGKGLNIPIPPIGADDRLIIGQLCSINHSGTSILYKSYKPEQRRLLLFASKSPKTLPRNSKSSISECIASRQELSVSTVRSFAFLRGCVIVARVHAVYRIQSVDGISDCSGECTNSVLMGTFWDDTITVSKSTESRLQEENQTYPARDVRPTVGLIPTNAFLSAGLITTQRNSTSVVRASHHTRK